mmetsp:Transcript_67861/g.126798  ORF Transcript_67861/g.126798 Transcript_67861/m.126798 type:complete len:188 (-) Transcript_67861:218-781(-)
MAHAMVLDSQTEWHITHLGWKDLWAQRGRGELHMQNIEDDYGNVVAKVVGLHVKWMYRRIVDVQTGQELFTLRRMARYGRMARNIHVQRGGVTIMLVRFEGWPNKLVAYEGESTEQAPLFVMTPDGCGYSRRTVCNSRHQEVANMSYKGKFGKPPVFHISVAPGVDAMMIWALTLSWQLIIQKQRDD